MTCKNCGSNVAEGSKFCNHCGSKLEPAGQSCPNPDCRKSGLPADALYCLDCGTRLDTCTGSSPVVAVEVPEHVVLIRGGEFMMGSSGTEPERSKDEMMHRVRVSDFYLSRYAVTQAEWESVMRSNPSHFKGATHPVEQVSWNDCQEFLQMQQFKSGKTYRLPTEAEWEYACRAGSTTPFNTGTNLTTEQANYQGNFPYNGNAKGKYRQTTVPVESFAPNAFWLYNMHGNVWEWCSDWYGAKYYDECKAKGVVENPQGTSSGSNRVLRGGSWFSHARYCQSALRYFVTPDFRNTCVGFRLVCVP